MTMGRPLRPLDIRDESRAQLESISRSRSMPHMLVRRAKIVLMSEQGLSNQQIGEQIGLSGASVGKWRRRFCEQGLMGLYDELRPGAPRSIGDEKIASLIHKTLKKKPKGATHWTCRSIASEANLSKSTVQRVWKAFGLQPHLAETLQAVQRPLFRREGQRHRRPLLESSGQRYGAVRRREKPNSSIGTNATDPASGSWLCRGRYAQLHQARHHNPVRGARDCFREGPHPMQTPPPAPGVFTVPQIR